MHHWIVVTSVKLVKHYPFVGVYHGYHGRVACYGRMGLTTALSHSVTHVTSSNLSFRVRTVCCCSSPALVLS